MMYLDHGATSFPKPQAVEAAMVRALRTCANPGRGGYTAAMRGANLVFRVRQMASELFDCKPEQVVFTGNCTQGLNIAMRTLIRSGDRVAISGFEHNAVTRTLRGLGAQAVVAGRILFDPEDTLRQFVLALRSGVKAAVFTHVSNVFGYILPVEEMAAACREYEVPFVVDAAQSAGCLPVTLSHWGADFVAMPGHKGLLGPQGTGILLCNRQPEPMLFGGTGSESALQEMPAFLPDRLEAGTLNVPGIAGLGAGIQWVARTGTAHILRQEQATARQCVKMLQDRGYRVFFGQRQTGTVSFTGQEDCQRIAEKLARQGVAVRAGLHCAPLAHQSAGTFPEGTVRISFGAGARAEQVAVLAEKLPVNSV